MVEEEDRMMWMREMREMEYREMMMFRMRGMGDWPDLVDMAGFDGRADGYARDMVDNVLFPMGRERERIRIREGRAGMGGGRMDRPGADFENHIPGHLRGRGNDTLQTVKIDCFKALKDPGDKLQHTVLAQISAQMDLASGMRGAKWWIVSYVGMKYEANPGAPPQEVDAATAALFAKLNLKQCLQCQAMVGKTQVCNAMDCVCNLVFCFKCLGVANPGETGFKQCQCSDVQLQTHSNGNRRSELEAANFRSSVRSIGEEIHRIAETPEFGKAARKCLLFVEIRDGLLVPNPSCKFNEAEKLCEFVGQIMGASARAEEGAEKVALNLAPLMWKQVLGHEVRWEDVAWLEPELEKEFKQIQLAVADNGNPYTESEFKKSNADFSFTVSYSGARPPKAVDRVVGGSAIHISYWTRDEHVHRAKHAHLRTTHDADAHSALKRCARGLECTQHSVHSKS